MRFSRAFAVAIPVFAIPLQAAQLLPADWNVRTSLPLHLCDIAWPAAVIALWTHRPWAASLTYYWGLTLTTQAMITPSLGEALPDPRFFMYWGMHFVIVWAAIYLTWGLGITPTWHGYRVTVVATAGWALFMYTFNSVAGTNYGYLNEKPATASILDLLGPWPVYVILEIGIVLVAWALMTWPWTRAASRQPATPRGVAAR